MRNRLSENPLLPQLAAMLVFAGLAVDVFLRLRKNRSVMSTPHAQAGKLKPLGWGIALATAAIIIRGGYRTAELSQGWGGYLLREPHLILLLRDERQKLTQAIKQAKKRPFAFWTRPSLSAAKPSSALSGPPTPRRRSHSSRKNQWRRRPRTRVRSARRSSLGRTRSTRSKPTDQASLSSRLSEKPATGPSISSSGPSIEHSLSILDTLRRLVSFC